MHLAQPYVDGLSFIVQYYRFQNYQVPKKPNDKASSISLHVKSYCWEEFSFCLSTGSSPVVIHSDIASWTNFIAINFSKDDGTYVLADLVFRGVDSEYKRRRVL